MEMVLTIAVSMVRNKSPVPMIDTKMDCTDEFRKDEACLQLKMKKHFLSKLENCLAV